MGFVTFFLFALIQIKAASLQTALSAPVKPSNPFRISFNEKLDNGIPFECILKMASLRQHLAAGRAKLARIYHCEAERVNHFWSIGSCNNYDSVNRLTPSILASNWLTTLLETSLPSPELEFLMFVIDSNSSKKMIEGDDCLAFFISRTARSDSPTHFDIISGPLMLMKFACASLAIALASNVFPVPGAPNITIPRGGLIPKWSNNSGLVNGHSTDSFNLLLTSSNPPISSQVTSGTST